MSIRASRSSLAAVNKNIENSKSSIIPFPLLRRHHLHAQRKEHRQQHGFHPPVQPLRPPERHYPGVRGADGREQQQEDACGGGDEEDGAGEHEEGEEPQ